MKLTLFSAAIYIKNKYNPLALSQYFTIIFNNTLVRALVIA